MQRKFFILIGLLLLACILPFYLFSERRSIEKFKSSKKSPPPPPPPPPPTTQSYVGAYQALNLKSGAQAPAPPPLAQNGTSCSANSQCQSNKCTGVGSSKKCSA